MIWIAWAIILLGHLGIWISLYNRINATGLHRLTLKHIEKSFVIACAVIPLVIVLYESWTVGLLAWFGDALSGKHLWSTPTLLYMILAGAFCVIVGPLWILDRPQFAWAKNRYRINASHELHPSSNGPRGLEHLIVGHKFQRMAQLPRNQIASLQQNHKQLLISRLPKSLVGLKVGHLSDIHLTGQLSPAFYRLAIDWLIDQAPDLIVLSGDIVDYEHALKDLEPVLAGLKAPLGMYFVLGNHDKRLKDPMQICDALVRMGWTDLGRNSASCLYRGCRVELMGNEAPWFHRHESEANDSPSPNETDRDCLRIGVSHSPDQFRWGIQHGCQLLLCGHTHGGQIRFRVIGPVIAPSWYGSRYASGVFEKSDTVMHVSRGLSGIHPYRWGCLPEVSLLELVSFDS